VNAITAGDQLRAGLLVLAYVDARLVGGTAVRVRADIKSLGSIGVLDLLKFDRNRMSRPEQSEQAKGKWREVFVHG
jgi:hypothetical protein